MLSFDSNLVFPKELHRKCVHCTHDMLHCLLSTRVHTQEFSILTPTFALSLRSSISICRSVFCGKKTFCHSVSVSCAQWKGAKGISYYAIVSFSTRKEHAVYCSQPTIISTCTYIWTHAMKIITLDFTAL